MSQYYDRFSIALEPAESTALVQYAKRERRTKKAQAAWIIHQALEKLDMLPPTPVSKLEKLEAAWEKVVNLYPDLEELLEDKEKENLNDPTTK